MDSTSPTTLYAAPVGPDTATLTTSPITTSTSTNHPKHKVGPAVLRPAAVSDAQDADHQVEHPTDRAEDAEHAGRGPQDQTHIVITGKQQAAGPQNKQGPQNGQGTQNGIDNACHLQFSPAGCIVFHHAFLLFL